MSNACRLRPQIGRARGYPGTTRIDRLPRRLCSCADRLVMRTRSRRSASPSSTRSRRHAFEQLDEPFGAAGVDGTERHPTVCRLGPPAQLIEPDIDERLTNATAQRLRATLLSLDVSRTRLIFVGVEARQELIDRTRSARQRVRVDLRVLTDPPVTARPPR